MKRNHTPRERRGISPFCHIRFGLYNEDEFAAQLPAGNEIRPDFFRWFCGMHDLKETFICRAL